MTTPNVPTPARLPNSRRAPRWPALVAACYIGVFCLVTSAVVG